MTSTKISDGEESNKIPEVDETVPIVKGTVPTIKESIANIKEQIKKEVKQLSTAILLKKKLLNRLYQ